MTGGIVSVSQAELAQRRRQLRHQRRVRVLQSIWRITAVSGLAGGLIWLATSPAWVLRKPAQVKVVGNQFIRAERVRALLPIRYPQSLLKLEPKAIATGLKAKMPLTEVTVNRHLFPPGLTVQVKERRPVAIALPEPTDLQNGLEKSATPQAKTAKPGLLDEGGTWISLESYTTMDQLIKLPTLQVLGNFDQYHLSWSKLYQDVTRSPVKISEIDWRDPNNLILKTELGIVHFGPYSTQFSYQLNVLDKMRKLPNSVSSNDLAYIDLRNPAAPTVQMGKI